jgi:uncharacterized damage-inducible protein DinB
MAQEHSIIQLLLTNYEQLYRGKPWHGPTLRGSLMGLTAQEASGHRSKSGHSIADIAIHCAYWKYAVRRRLSGGKRGAFPWKGSNWFSLPIPLTDANWKAILETLDAEHDALYAVIEAYPEKKLMKKQAGSRFLPIEMIQGIAAHDVYHAGQIRLLKPVKK